MSYGDKLINPTSTVVPSSFLSSPLKQDSTRALGLTHAKLKVNWITDKRTSLHLTLRPDYELYNNDNGIYRDFDSRTGTTYEKSQTVRLLDLYSLSFYAGKSLALTTGVFESIAPYWLAYSTMTEFGLNVRLLEKYFGLDVEWRIDDMSFPTATPQVITGKRFHLIVFQGRDDRSDNFQTSESTYDIAPNSNDPHKGVGLKFRWIPSSDFQSRVFVGFRENEGEDRSSGSLLAALAWHWQFDFMGHRTFLKHDSRYHRQRWDIPNVNAKTLNQISTSLSANIGLAQNVSIISGFHYGISEHLVETDPTKANTYSGWQFDLGTSRQVNESLLASLLTSYETRELDQQGSTIGGFNEANQPKKKIARFVVQMEYKLRN